MTSNCKLRGILSLSAASAALLQSAVLTEGQSAEISAESNMMPGGQITAKTDKLIIEPAHQKELLQLYAAHTSHASHSSHVSGASDSTIITPYYPPTTPPITYPTTPPPPPPPQPIPAVQASVSTNAVSSTNSTVSEAAKKSAHIDDLTKQAAAGNSYAQYSLGICYLYGSDGAKQNTEKAKMLLELAAVQGNAFAKQRLEELNQSETKPETLKK